MLAGRQPDASTLSECASSLQWLRMKADRRLIDTEERPASGRLKLCFGRAGRVVSLGHLGKVAGLTQSPSGLLWIHPNI